jgi:hypothetical protein
MNYVPSKPSSKTTYKSNKRTTASKIVSNDTQTLEQEQPFKMKKASGSKNTNAFLMNNNDKKSKTTALTVNSNLNSVSMSNMPKEHQQLKKQHENLQQDNKISFVSVAKKRRVHKARSKDVQLPFAVYRDDSSDIKPLQTTIDQKVKKGIEAHALEPSQNLSLLTPDKALTVMKSAQDFFIESFPSSKQTQSLSISDSEDELVSGKAEFAMMGQSKK